MNKEEVARKLEIEETKEMITHILGENIEEKEPIQSLLEDGAARFEKKANKLKTHMEEENRKTMIITLCCCPCITAMWLVCLPFKCFGAAIGIKQ